MVQESDFRIVLHDGDLEHRHEVDRELLEPSSDPSAVLEPTNATLDGAAATIGKLVEDKRPATVIADLVASLRDDRSDGMATKPAADSWKTVALVAGDESAFSARS